MRTSPAKLVSMGPPQNFLCCAERESGRLRAHIEGLQAKIAGHGVATVRDGAGITSLTSLTPFRPSDVCIDAEDLYFAAGGLSAWLRK